MTLFVGTSGWAYPEWKPAFYPQGCGPARFLNHYSSVFNACEINRTFYGLCAEDAVRAWARTTPEGFRFTAKVHRRLTHTVRIKMRDRVAFIDEYLASLAPLEGRLTALLWQFPATRERDDSFLHALLDALPGEIPSAFEFRHDSWSAPEIDTALEQAGAVRALAAEEPASPGSLPSGPIGYVRLRADRYSARERQAWLELVEREAKRRDVFVFAKHRDAAPDDPYAGLGMARWMREKARRDAPV